ncbi:MAG: UDP-N-acetylglucosamine--N-acetylmuramyl-(pentapeptide) pyrophosphoryl-undecaprenol N-acetylglucosamine transferase [Parcubacteria group bacterium ADurb.Bin316]|nr:MAG: UDP-N-acetylglucosamine--N-acetylmuramyl-(pentapeptide) pyrophosphoryl-undecaprenol N-acetylglucosamine transferase [Parcubacteria group bacterium ADurb.Bin316]HOZ56420.1 undecaprenyldiphospho-muramoylpentapeptide beta-N-acetylglucosaminyltransferase [bacterium]
MTLTNRQKKYKILFSGGGTGGSVAPLLAIFEELKNDPSFEFVWIGTKDGLEKEMIGNKNIKYYAICAGKLRRYWSYQNVIDIFNIFLAFWQSLFIILKENSCIIISAGSFVSVPLAWAGWFCRIPILIHQQDVLPGLANKLMALIAKKITTTFEKSLHDYGKKAEWIGNPIRRELIENKVGKAEAYQKLGLKSDWPTLLVLGGGTGAMAINKLIENNLKELLKFCQIIHITGKGKLIINTDNSNYHSFEFLDTFGLIKVFAAADIVISRCGMNVLTELSYLGKPTILIPIPNSHQEANAKIFADNNAAIVLDQNKLSDRYLVDNVKELINNKRKQTELGDNIQKVIKKEANQELVKIVKEILQEVKIFSNQI